MSDVFSTGIYKVVEKAGGVSALARDIKVSRQAAYVWLQRGWAPPKRAVQLEERYGVPRGELMNPLLVRGSYAEVAGVS